MPALAAVQSSCAFASPDPLDQAIQQELAQLADLGRRVHSTEQMKEKHRSRLHLVKQERAS